MIATESDRRTIVHPRRKVLARATEASQQTRRRPCSRRRAIPVAGVTKSSEPLTALAGTAGGTDRIRLGVGVLALAARPLALAAAQIASLQLLSGARLLLGVRLGPPPTGCPSLYDPNRLTAAVDALRQEAARQGRVAPGVTVGCASQTPTTPTPSRPSATRSSTPTASHPTPWTSS